MSSTAHLIPDDEDWFEMLRRIEEPLLWGLSGAQDGDRVPMGSAGWNLPAAVASDQAREAWWRVYQAVKDGLDVARRRRLLASDGRRELAPLALVDVADRDVDVLTKLGDECNRALAGLGSSDLAELLGQLAEGFQRQPSELIADLIRVAATLRLAVAHARASGEDRLPDVDVLTAAIRGTTADLVLTPDQERAYARFARRWVAATEGDHLRLFALGVE